jgi:hypothetical protein
VLLLALIIPTAARGQTATAGLSGTVVDESDAIVADASVTLEGDATGIRRTMTTTADGRFVFVALPPGRYRVSAERSGFQKTQLPPVTLEVGDQLTVQLKLTVGSLSDAVTVTASAPTIRTTPGLATVIDRQFVSNLPLNGRSFQSLIGLTPGVIPTVGNTTQQGQFSVNGARESANTFNIDGVSANVGISASGANFNGASGQFAGYDALGATTSLVSVESLQEFTIQTSGFAPEYGRTPGGQVSIVTRSGTNVYSGSAFEYFRHDALDANDFFANRLGLPQQKLRNNQFGGVLGGPLRVPRVYDGRNAFFFFASYEGLRLRLPTVTTVDVPSRATRSAATGPLAEIVNAFPVPTGPDLPNGLAQFSGGYSLPSSVDATSLRLDRTFAKGLTLFGRYNHAPSETASRGVSLGSLSVLTPSTQLMRTLTVGATAVIASRSVNDLRVNFSNNQGLQIRIPDTFGGAKVPSPAALFPSFTTPDDAVVSFYINGAGAAPALLLGSQGANRQRQLNIVDTFSLVAGAHQFKVGADYRRFTPLFDFISYQQTVNFASIAATLRGSVSTAFIQAFYGPLYPIYTNFSAFAQDTWTLSPRLTFTYGLRYEVNPAPSEGSGHLPRTVLGVESSSTIALAPEGTKPFKTTFDNIAPRVGVAYTLSRRPGAETVVRGGAGIFYDSFSTQTGAAYRAFSWPFAATREPGAVPYPFAPEVAAPPPLSVAPPYPNIFASDPNLKLPYTTQFNLLLEQSLGPHQTVSATLIKNLGRRLYRTEFYLNQLPSFSQLKVVRNLDQSEYKALQLQYRRRLSSGLQVLAHYTLAKAMDTSSSEAQMYLPTAISPASANWAPSDFDRRHTAAIAVSYGPPAPAARPWRALFGDFWFDAIYKAMSASPVDIVSSSAAVGVVVRPDLVPNQPLAIADPSAPGGQRFNRAAFVIRTDNNGTTPRNVMRGFALYQLDAVIRRSFPMGSMRTEVRAEAFNVLNTPNFANPSGVLTASTFGTATQMVNRNIGGLNALYQIGGPRSIQLAIKVQF